MSEPVLAVGCKDCSSYFVFQKIGISGCGRERERGGSTERIGENEAEEEERGKQTKVKYVKNSYNRWLE